MFNGRRRRKGDQRLSPRWGPCKECAKRLGKLNSVSRLAAGKTLAYERRDKTKRIRLNTKFKRQYGITLADYERMAAYERRLGEHKASQWMRNERVAQAFDARTSESVRPKITPKLPEENVLPFRRKA